MVRILVFGMTSNPGGIESVIMNYYRKIDRTKIQFDFLCNSNDVAYENEIKSLGGNIYKITPRQKNIFKFKKELNCFMKNNASKYSGIWMNVCSLTNIDYLVLAKKYNIKQRIIHCHNSANDSGRLKLMMHNYNKKRISKYATHFWSCSAEASPWFYTNSIINSKNYEIIVNGIDVKKFSPNEETRKRIRQSLNLYDKKVLGHVGRFHFQKNHEFLINLFAYLATQDDDYRLLLIGQGELEDKIKRMIHDKGLDNKVIMLGACNHIEDYYNAMDLFVLPSRFEGLGVVALEAQAADLPCVLSDKVPREVKVNDLVAFLPINNNYEKWEEKIKEYLTTVRLDSKMYMSEYNIDKQIQNFQKEFIDE